MKITFIRVNMFEHHSTDALKPLLFGIIRSVTPSDIEIDFIDDRVEKLPDTIDSDIIAFSIETYTAKRGYILAKKYKTENNTIVMGGFHASAAPDEILNYADTVIIGDAEDSWPQMLEDYRNGVLKRRYESGETRPLTVLSEDKSIYRHKYFGVGVYQISRGCKFNCDFCSIKTMYKCVRRKSPDMIIDELKRAKEKIIFFVDDNLFYDKKSALELFEKLRPLKKKWACQISMDVGRDDELLTAMYKAGCILVLMGFESLNPKSLEMMNKVANHSARDYEEIIQNIYRHHMLIYGTFVLGYDGDDATAFQQIYDFSVKNALSVTNFNPLIPMPGTGVYKRMEQEGRLLYKKWWLSDNYRYGDTAYMPKNMTPDELKKGCLKIRTDFYSYRCIFKRLFSNRFNFRPINLFVFLAANLVSHREILKKQGQMLGGILGEADTD
ncbi:MAG: B12-binding domain-containing radical SAM protein [Lachnospiraceae bacterium]|nr:B12-binding domain-containing radical SAM protein [Lachnospiraceae bacterium]